MNITPLSQNNFSAAIDLLKKNNLPTDDISEVTKLFILEDGKEVVGTIALEYAGTEGLLRSLSVSDQKRNKGLGVELVNFIEDWSRRQGVQQLYLLTTTADSFFSKRGYTKIDRNTVPQFIRNTSEFSAVCPASATVMKKDLS